MVRLENQPDAHFHVDAFRLAGLFRKAISYDARVEVSVHSVLSGILLNKLASPQLVRTPPACSKKRSERQGLTDQR